ncbi:Transcriptional regulatory protein YycF [Tautonia plasticadhaerens]|uniref:Transcriptional regulatory protein YycF n=2 Tax=Tautonia plasticadhaerens TaxID=2527974 RepID=A0A518H8Q4_9BACT|nr:Transcriptional regulatory protein YycF [Tautonia plasticadhaerens]
MEGLGVVTAGGSDFREESRAPGEGIGPDRTGCPAGPVEPEQGPGARVKGAYPTMKTVFTTGEAAKICKVSQQTIIRCFDSGQLKGFRVPGSRFRRIPRDALYRFMRENNIPTDALESGRRKILVVDDEPEVVQIIKDALLADGRFEVKDVDNGFGAGMMAKEYHPDLMVLDIMLPDINGKAVCELVRRDPSMSDIKIFCISGMIEEDKIDDLKESGADDFMSKPLDVDELIRRICKHLDLEMPATP